MEDVSCPLDNVYVVFCVDKQESRLEKIDAARSVSDRHTHHTR